MRDAIKLIMDRIIKDYPFIVDYDITECDDNRYSLHVTYNNLECEGTIGNIGIDFNKYFMLLGKDLSKFSVRLEPLFYPSEFIDIK